jgi:integrase
MAEAEKRERGKYWRARWRGPDGRRESRGGFASRKEALRYAKDQEAAIRFNTYLDPRAGRITLNEWANRWYPGLNLELGTLSNYRYYIEVHILPAFGELLLTSLTTESIARWEKETIARGYTPKVAREARSTLSNMLADAIPRYLQANPAARRRGKGRRGQRRIQRAERAERQWATPLEVLLFAERCSALSGSDTDFVMITTVAYTGMRWSEALGLLPGCLQDNQLRIDWKLYELEGRFYRGRPKDGSIRTVDMPPFLAGLLGWYLATYPPRICTCDGTQPPWCPGERYVFLGPRSGHFRRSNYSSRVVRPAADGWHPKRGGPHARLAMPVLADMAEPLPGRLLPPWPAAAAGDEFEPPRGKGVRRISVDEKHGQCPSCGRAGLLRLDGTLVRHKVGRMVCPGTGQQPKGAAPASWLPVRRGLSPHGLRHGHKTWLDDLGVQETLKSERMGHDVPGMAGVYGHVMPEWRDRLRSQLEQVWEASLRERARLSPRSSVAIVDALIAPDRATGTPSGPTMAPLRASRRIRLRSPDRKNAGQ